MPKQPADTDSAGSAAGAASPSNGFDETPAQPTDAFGSMVSVGPNQSVQDAIDETALAVPDEAAAPVGVGGWTQAPQFDSDDIGFPRIRLAQGLTPEVTEGTAKMGQLLYPGIDAVDEITFVPVSYAKTRAKKADPSNRDSEVVCTSADGRVGVGDPGGACVTCPHAQWTTDPRSGKRLPPACSVTYHYAGYVDVADGVGELQFTRTSEAAAKMVNNHAAARGLGRFALQVSGVVKRAGNRAWAEPVCKLVPLTDELRRATQIAMGGGTDPA